MAAAAVAVAVSAAARAEAAAPREVGDMYFTYAAAILCGIVVLWYLLTYNSLIGARNAVDQAWSHIEVELQRRLDLIGNLVEVVKGYAKHESETFQQVAALRTQARPFGDAAAANSVVAAAQPLDRPAHGARRKLSAAARPTRAS